MSDHLHDAGDLPLGEPIPPMRSRVEIQAAHDLISMALIAGADDIFPKLPESALLSTKAARDTLCWVLRHDTTYFEANLTDMMAILEGRAMVEEETNVDPR